MWDKKYVGIAAFDAPFSQVTPLGISVKAYISLKLSYLCLVNRLSDKHALNI